MIGRERTEGCTEQRIGTGGEDLQRLVAPLDGEQDTRALGAPDPVALHEPHLVGPARQFLQRFQQLVGEAGDAEEPLREPALLDQRARAPAAPVHDLLVGEHRIVDRIPVDPRLLPLDQSGLEEVEEQCLLMRVIAGVAGGELALPIDREPHQPQLPAHRRDVRVGPLGRMDAALERRVLRRKAEGIPAHGMEHVEPPRPLVARDDVAHRVVAHVAHVDAARGIREHLQDVVSRASISALRPEQPRILPGGLPLGLDRLRVVTLTHRPRSLPYSGRRRRAASL